MRVQQRILADFGEFALRSNDLDEVLTEACRLVGEALGTDLAKVIEIESAERTLFVRAGVGWETGVVGHVRLPMGERSSETYSVEQGTPIVTPNIGQEDRFDFPAFMVNAGVCGAVNVPIFLPGGKPYGLLQVDSRTTWQPDEQTIEFLRTYSTILGPVIDRLDKIHALGRAEARNETLLRELQHRVKNNIGAITGLLHMRLRKVQSDEVRDELRVVAERIEALRLVHELVYAAKGTDRLPLRTYVTQLIEGVLALHRETPVQLDTCIDDVDVSTDTAIPLGLILNEFATNSLKHAFKDESGCLRIDARQREDRLWVRIGDNGKGLPTEKSASRPGTGTGMALITGLSRQIGAKLEWTSDNGTALCLEFQY
ncbi:sensor histidine kinase [Sphingomonas xinjiangensis]|nr:histidine kinase dimerization/phosphoacceptor domain -containing protein [Sphingomonas xinjiangensis]